MIGTIPGTTSTTSSSGYASAYGTANYSASAYGSGGYAYGSGTASAYAYGSYSGHSTTTTDPQFYTYYLPYQRQVNSYQLGFFRMAKPPVFGVYAVPLDEETRKEIQRNSGALVTLVVNRSPAFRANLMSGDVITQIGDFPVELPDDIPYLSQRYEGLNTTVEFFRDGKQWQSQVQFGTMPKPTLEQIQTLAKRGSIEAQWELGNRYRFANGLPQDYEQALAWYEKAAARDFAPAQTSIGAMYAQGQGFPENFAEARAWFQKAAEQNYVPGLINLALIYFNGQGVPKNNEVASQLFRQASEQGDPDAITMLGIICAEGDAGIQDKVQALKWFTVAAEMGSSLAEEERKAIMTSMSEEQVEEAAKLAMEWRNQRYGQQTTR